jgi:hypothetical protein
MYLLDSLLKQANKATEEAKVAAAAESTTAATAAAAADKPSMEVLEKQVGCYGLLLLRTVA